MKPDPPRYIIHNMKSALHTQSAFHVKHYFWKSAGFRKLV